MELSEDQIKEINKKCPYDQGIFKEPFGVNHIKEPVIYMRWNSGGVNGGSCWESSNPQPYVNHNPKPDWKALDIVIETLKPNITYMQYKKIAELVVSTEKTEWEYYGNCEEFEITYIKVSDLLNLLETF